MAPAQQPTFYYDLGSPYAWLAAERIHALLPVVPVWQPILLGGIWQQSGGRSWGITDERDEGMREIERRADAYGLLPVKWPDDWPTNTLKAMRAAVFAQQAGRGWSFSKSTSAFFVSVKNVPAVAAVGSSTAFLTRSAASSNVVASWWLKA